MQTEAKILAPRPFWNRQRLSDRFLKLRELTEKICLPLSDEDCMLSATEDTSPAKWHLAHTTWFFEHFILNPHSPNYKAFDDHFEYLFNSYYRAVGEFLPKSKRALLSKPTLEHVFHYRENTNNAVVEVIENASEEVFQKIAPLIELGIHHEQQHQELMLMDIKQNFFLHPLRPAYLHEENTEAQKIKIAVPQAEFINFRGGLSEIGNNSSDFHYDNEEGRHRVWVDSFQLASHLVTNGRFHFC
jgi:ergothioneine biosynthesis protein EgtB